MKSKVLIAVLMVILFSGMCIIESNMQSMKPKDPADRTSSVYMLAGEFRTVFANLLWIKAETYHHEFIQRDPNWTKDKELLGIITMITALDPHFAEAYESGAYIYADGEKNTKKAVNYLCEGIANNPKSWELHQLLAIFYYRKMHNSTLAIEHQKLAVAYCSDKFYKQVAERSLKDMEKNIK